MSTIIQAYAAHKAGGELKPFEYNYQIIEAPRKLTMKLGCTGLV